MFHITWAFHTKLFQVSKAGNDRLMLPKCFYKIEKKINETQIKQFRDFAEFKSFGCVFIGLLSCWNPWVPYCDFCLLPWSGSVLSIQFICSWWTLKLQNFVTIVVLRQMIISLFLRDLEVINFWANSQESENREEPACISKNMSDFPVCFRQLHFYFSVFSWNWSHERLWSSQLICRPSLGSMRNSLEFTFCYWINVRCGERFEEVRLRKREHRPLTDLPFHLSFCSSEQCNFLRLLLQTSLRNNLFLGAKSIAFAGFSMKQFFVPSSGNVGLSHPVCFTRN